MYKSGSVLCTRLSPESCVPRQVFQGTKKLKCRDVWVSCDIPGTLRSLADDQREHQRFEHAAKIIPKFQPQYTAMLSAQHKTVHFVRHCQSTWNEAVYILKLTRLDKELQTEEYVDAPLSAFGEEQASKAKQKIQALNAEVAITSPFTRAIETCIRTYGDQNVVATPLCGEIGESICDIGRMKENLVELYPTIDFSSVPSDVWWYVDEKLKDQLTDPRKCYEWVLNNGTFYLGETSTDYSFQRRIELFYEFLQSRSESNIVVFSHSAFLRSFLLKHYGRPSSEKVPNGEILTYSL